MWKLTGIFAVFTCSGGVLAQQLPFAFVPGQPERPQECQRLPTTADVKQRCDLLLLEDLDAELNRAYGERAQSGSEDAGSRLQQAQRIWLRDRTRDCKLDARISDRAAWLRHVAASPERADCVAAKTRERIQFLQPRIAVREEPVKPRAAYELRSSQRYRTGRRYFEVVIEQGNTGLDRPVEAMVVARITDGTTAAETTFQIQPKDTVLQMGEGSVRISGGNLGDIKLPRVVIGVAADIDSGRVYFHRNGVWSPSAPGGREAALLKRGGEYAAEVASSAALKPLLDAGIVKVNFGDEPFEVGPPPGYSGFHLRASRATPLHLSRGASAYGQDEQVAGKDQVHWVREYWRWVRSFPPGGAPSNDLTGERCAARQSGPVWYLTGYGNSGSVSRVCEIPAGVAVLVPIVNSLAQVNPEKAASCSEAVQALRRFAENVSGLNLHIDGVALPAPDSYYRNTGCFELEDMSRRVKGLAVGSGYWVMLKPMAAGTYEIGFGGKFSSPDFVQDIKYTLRVRENAGAATAPKACTLAERLPSDFDVFHVGTYAGTSPAPQLVELDNSGHQVKKVDVLVNHPERPVVLVLTAYDPVIWNVAWAPGSVLAGAVVSGYHGQAIVGLPKSIPLVLSTYENRTRAGNGCPYFYSYMANQDYPAIATKIAAITGRDVTRFMRAPEKAPAVVGNGMLASWAKLESSSDYQLADFVVKRASGEVPAGKRGLDELVGAGFLRPATPQDVAAWQDQASQELRRYDPSARAAFLRGLATYVVLKPVTLPDGLYGGDSVVFIVPEGVSLPAGPRGHNTFYLMGQSRCQGPGC